MDGDDDGTALSRKTTASSALREFLSRGGRRSSAHPTRAGTATLTRLQGVSMAVVIVLYNLTHAHYPGQHPRPGRQQPNIVHHVSQH
jgi:hypothetical protein